MESHNFLLAKYTFSNFSRALEFVNQIAAVAEELGHHPDIALGWGYVTVQSTTHDAGNTVTKKDRELMDKIQSLFQNLN